MKRVVAEKMVSRALRYLVVADLRKKAKDRFSQRTKEFLKKYKGEVGEQDESTEYIFPDERSAKGFARDMQTINKKQYDFLTKQDLIYNDEDHGIGYHALNQSGKQVWISWDMP